MKYTPDLKYEKSLKLVEYLTHNKPLPRSYGTISEDEILELLLYNIEKKKKSIDDLRLQIKEYRSVFQKIGKFIGVNKSQVIYE